MAAAFARGFNKTAKFELKPQHLDHAGLATLALAPAYHGYKAIKDKDKGEAALAGTELAGLGLLSKAVSMAHK